MKTYVRGIGLMLSSIFLATSLAVVASAAPKAGAPKSEPAAAAPGDMGEKPVKKTSMHRHRRHHAMRRHRRTVRHHRAHRHAAAAKKAAK